MKRFVTIVLRSLVNLSKDNPIWVKEHHHHQQLKKKKKKRKRRPAKRAKNTGRRGLVRAVRMHGHTSVIYKIVVCLIRYISVCFVDVFCNGFYKRVDFLLVWRFMQSHDLETVAQWFESLSFTKTVCVQSLPLADMSVSVGD